MLEVFRSRSHVGRFRLLRHLLHPSDLRQGLQVPRVGRGHGLVHEFRLHDVGAPVRHLLCVLSAWIFYGSKLSLVC